MLTRVRDAHGASGPNTKAEREDQPISIGPLNPALLWTIAHPVKPRYQLSKKLSHQELVKPPQRSGPWLAPARKTTSQNTSATIF